MDAQKGKETSPSHPRQAVITNFQPLQAPVGDLWFNKHKRVIQALIESRNGESMYGNGQGNWRQGSLGAQFERIQHEAVLAISEAHAEATAAQYSQGSPANDTYGHTLKVRQHELLNAHLNEVPGIVLRRPEGVRSRFKFPRHR